MNTSNDGGAAFPRSGFYPSELATMPVDNLPAAVASITHGHRGMTLRDYFAAAAVPGILYGHPAGTPEQVASEAYAIADALILKREGGAA